MLRSIETSADEYVAGSPGEAALAADHRRRWFYYATSRAVDGCFSPSIGTNGLRNGEECRRPAGAPR